MMRNVPKQPTRSMTGWYFFLPSSSTHLIADYENKSDPQYLLSRKRVGG